MSVDTPTRKARRFKVDRDAVAWNGRYEPYDLVKEFLIALVVVCILVGGLAVIFGSPDDTPGHRSSPGPMPTPSGSLHDGHRTRRHQRYRHVRSAVQPERHHRRQARADQPRQVAGGPPPDRHGQRLRPRSTQHLAEPTGRAGRRGRVQVGRHGPTGHLDGGLREGGGRCQIHQRQADRPGRATTARSAKIVAAETAMARSGALDGALLSSRQFYGTDYTKPLLFIADGDYFANLGAAQHLSGEQWGMMNETGSYPGQAWLWLYTLWYQVGPIGNSDNADIMVFSIMIVLTALLALLPFIPGLRSIPRWTRLYRLIWRQHYREVERGAREPLRQSASAVRRRGQGAGLGLALEVATSRGPLAPCERASVAPR